MGSKVKEWFKNNRNTILIIMASWFVGVLMGWKAAGFPIFQKWVG